MKELELYIHVPFCVRKCAYCDFFSGNSREEEQRAYFDLLQKEIRNAENKLKTEYRVTSIFIGGGTPSSVPAELISDTLEEIRTEFHVDAFAEITMEANPGTLTKEKLEIYKKAGINRLSLGLQSTDDLLLQKLGRIHTFEAFLQSYQLARNAGFTNINIDLMSGIPGLTLDKWKETVEKVLSLHPEHISSYSLIIEEGTPFYEKYGEGKSDFELPTEEMDREMVHLTNQMLKEHGYVHYEVSNYALPSFECKHNIGYWTGKEYLGFGAAASSYIGSNRFTHRRTLTYLEEPDEEVETLSLENKMEEFMFLGLRMLNGISEEEFERRFGKKVDDIYGPVLKKYTTLSFLKREEGRIFFSEDKMDVMNTILVDFLF